VCKLQENRKKKYKGSWLISRLVLKILGLLIKRKYRVELRPSRKAKECRIWNEIPKIPVIDSTAY